MKEIWKPIIGYEGYFVSNLGRVKSSGVKREIYQYKAKKRMITIMPTKILKQRDSGHKPNKSKYGYFKINLGRGNQKYTHRLVALMFVPNPYNNPQVDHIDGNSRNNKADNLRWVTQIENVNNPNTKVISTY